MSGRIVQYKGLHFNIKLIIKNNVKSKSIILVHFAIRYNIQ